jgi:hypothetical protein
MKEDMNMNHETALNMILANACPVDTAEHHLLNAVEAYEKLSRE